ncbi:alpha/beta hydrolase [Cupriavidus lacunae]|uniref:Alpha/beta hydrolase n=1 Tax=Cupriavidus lacunae TaxID=2666307 RepID=A0A370NXV9_9BURK|nr:alpha/beta fold hydrolase [Cupriavidus lacunae]RDK10446.1 alpha/beta hydrolase [Cupriavidus lacunae]
MPSGPRPAHPPARYRWLAAAVGLGLAAGVARHLLFRAVERKAFVTPMDETSDAAPPDNSTPTVRHATFASGDRILHAASMPAADPEAPALMVCHGDNECLSDWAPVQAMLASAGIASYVFDYSGYGHSTGRPSVRRLRQDTLAAYRDFIGVTPQAERRVVLGHSLGSGILLDVARRFDPQPDGYVIAAGFSSARLAAVQTGRVPAWAAWAAWLLPDPWDNAARASKLERPLLVVHSRDDAVIVPPHAERVANSARHLHALIMHDAMPHNAAILPEHIAAFWPPIMRFVRAQDGNAAQAVLAGDDTRQDARQEGNWREAGNGADTLATAGGKRRQ